MSESTDKETFENIEMGIERLAANIVHMHRESTGYCPDGEHVKEYVKHFMHQVVVYSKKGIRNE